MKTLVVYFSRKGSVRRVAEQTAQQLDAALYEVKTSERTSGFFGFWWCGRFGMHRWGMPIQPLSTDLTQYDKVIICSPIWVLSICAPIRSFLELAHGQIKAVDYILVHFSFPMRYPGTLQAMDSLLGVQHGRCTSIVCQRGKCLARREFL